MVANSLHIALAGVMPELQLETVCIFLPPALSGLTPLLSYALATKLKDENAGLVAAGIVAVVPAYTSRTGAGVRNLCHALANLTLTATPCS